MIRKAAVLAGVLALLGGVFFGTDAFSYVGTSIGWVKQSVKDSIPLDFEIARARDMIGSIMPDIRKNMHTIAKEEVEVEQLANQIATLQGRVDRDRGELVRLRNDLSTGRDVFQYAGRSYSADQVRVDLARRFDRFKTTEATLASLEEMHGARQKSLAAARAKLEGMLASKRQLEVEVEHLEARLKMVEAAQTSSAYTFDDSQLSRAKGLVSDLRSRLNVAERLVNSEGYFHEEIPLDESASESIVDEVTHYLGLIKETHVAEAPNKKQK